MLGDFRKIIVQLLNGFMSAAIAMYVTHPFDTIKTQYQANNQGCNIKSIVRNIYQQQGINGFFKGCASTLPTYPVFWGIFFSIRNQNIKYSDNYIINSIATNFLASTIASTICNPLFVLKTRKQTLVTKNQINGSYFREISTIYQLDGIRGFGKGLPVTLLSNLRFIIQFPLYDIIMVKTFQNIFFSSIISKLTANTLFYPTNIIGTIQRDHNGKLSIKSAINSLYQIHGFKGLYRGLWLYNIASVSNFTIMMIVKDKLDKLHRDKIY